MAIFRNMLKILGLLGAVIVLGGAYRSLILLGASIAAIFLGITDFGRQCPLILSVRHLIYRIKSKHQHTQ
jgi:hypothetical protein